MGKEVYYLVGWEVRHQWERLMTVELRRGGECYLGILLRSASGATECLSGATCLSGKRGGTSATPATNPECVSVYRRVGAEIPVGGRTEDFSEGQRV